MKVLVVEDNADAGAAFAMLLEMEGHQVTVVGSVATALDAGPHDVAFIDLSLPDGSGRDVASAKVAPVCVAVTGHNRSEVWDSCVEAGFTEYLRKPVDFDEITTLLAKLA